MARQLLQENAEFDVAETELELDIPVDPEASYTLRPITTEYARSVYKQHTTKVPNRRTHQMDDQVNQVAVSNALLDYCIVRWAGVFENGAAAPCDLVHKLRLPTVVQAALVERAQIGGTAERRAASFREPSSVV
jgi:hypothetical protein